MILETDFDHCGKYSLYARERECSDAFVRTFCYLYHNIRWINASNSLSYQCGQRYHAAHGQLSQLLLK